MKHEAMVKRILAEFHEPWMEEDDKEAIDNAVLAEMGGMAEFERQIETGIANGYSAELQEDLARTAIRHKFGFGNKKRDDFKLDLTAMAAANPIEVM